MPLNWNATKEEHEIISAIAERGIELMGGQREGFTRMDLHMDIEATHCNGCPLKLQELLEADDFNFGHDLGGIRRHLNRETGQLRDFFLPRFAVPAAERESATS